MRKKILCAVLCAIFAVAASARAQTTLPEPSQSPREMIFGEKSGETLHTVAIYYASADGVSLTPVYRTLSLSADASLVEAVLNVIIESSATIGGLSSAPSDTRVLSCEDSGGVVTVNLSIDARNVQNEQELFIFCAVIQNTLLDISGVSAVNVLINGRHVGIGQLPLGARTEKIINLATAWAQERAEYERFTTASSAASVTFTRNAYLYLPGAVDARFLPLVTSVDFSSNAYATQILMALKNASAQTDAVMRFPNAVDWLIEDPQIVVTEAGERVLNVNFTGSVLDALARKNIARWQFFGAVTLSLCSFIPNLDYVRVSVNSETLKTLDNNGFSMTLSDGLLRRADFSSRIGARAEFYISGGTDGLLQKSTRILACREAVSPRALLYALFSDANAPFPDGVGPADFLGVAVSDSVATVNLSAGFYSACQTLTAVEERNAVYSIVNMLCAISDIRGVKILIEGNTVETLSQAIYLKTILLPNPGCVEAET